MLNKKGQMNLIRKIEGVENKLFEVRNSKKIIVVCMIGVVLVTLGILAYSFFKFYQFVDKNKVIIQSPIHIQFLPLIVIEERKAQVISPIPVEKKEEAKVETKLPMTEKDIVNATKHGAILWRIYGLETTWGKNDYCRNAGKGYGGFGVLNQGKIVCYPTFEKAVERAEYWLVKNGVDENLPVALCRWNIGTAIDDCDYYKTYLTME